MYRLEVRELTKDQYPIWDNLVDDSPQGTIFHKSFWLTTCSRALARELKTFGCFENQKLIGGCSVFVRRIGGLTKIASSVCDMTPYGGLIISHPENQKGRAQEIKNLQIVKSLCHAFAGQHFDHVQLINSPDLVDIRPFIWNGWDSNVQYAYYLKLDSDMNRIISKKVIWRTRRAVKDGVSVRKSSDLSGYYRLYTMTFERQKLRTPVSQAFLMTMMQALQTAHSGEILISETPSGEIAAADIIIWDNKRAYAWTGASHTQLRASGAPSLLVLSECDELRTRGFREYNIMSANLPHLASFAAGFNPRLVPYYAVQKSAAKYLIARSIQRIFKRVLSRAE